MFIYNQRAALKMKMKEKKRRANATRKVSFRIFLTIINCMLAFFARGPNFFYNNSKNNKAISLQNFLTINKYLLGILCENFK